MKVKQFSGDIPIVLSGTLMSFNVSDVMKIIVELDDGKELEIQWEFEFTDDTSGPTVDLLEEGNAQIFVCTNFWSENGNCNVTPVCVYSDESKEYYMKFFVSGVYNATRKLDYCLYEVEKK